MPSIRRICWVRLWLGRDNLGVKALGVWKAIVGEKINRDRYVVGEDIKGEIIVNEILC